MRISDEAIPGSLVRIDAAIPGSLVRIDAAIPGSLEQIADAAIAGLRAEQGFCFLCLKPFSLLISSNNLKATKGKL